MLPKVGQFSVRGRSRMAIDALASLQPSTWAVTMAVCGPTSCSDSSVEKLKVPEVCPARIVTVVGTASNPELEESVTAISLTGDKLKVTVPWELVPWVALAGRLTVSTACSSSFTRILPLADTIPDAVAEITALRGPSSRELLATVMAKVAESCPAGMVTETGTVIFEVSLEDRLRHPDLDGKSMTSEGCI